MIIIIIIIIKTIHKIYIAPYIICKEIALRHFTNIIKCKTDLREHSKFMENKAASDGILD